VERIRPYQLEPFNFEKSNMSDGLWVAEGFTQYYGDLLVKRAGLMDETDFLVEMSGLVNTKMNRPGAQDYTPVENSQRAIFVDAGVSIDKTNYPNMYASYYTHGGALAMALDLDLRSRFTNKSLDDLMRVLWRNHGKKEKPYTVEDLQTALSSVTNPDYAATFFKKYVYGHDYFDYAGALLPAGLHLEPINKGEALIGPVSFAGNRNDLMIAGNTIKNTPLYKAGADIDDIIISLDGKNLKERKELEEALISHKPGDKVNLVFMHRNKMITSEIELTENNFVQIKPLGTSMADEKATAFKTAWMGDKTK
jgi:predicted metalloprotease with PDZ domain